MRLERRHDRHPHTYASVGFLHLFSSSILRSAGNGTLLNGTLHTWDEEPAELSEEAPTQGATRSNGDKRRQFKIDASETDSDSRGMRRPKRRVGFVAPTEDPGSNYIAELAAKTFEGCKGLPCMFLSCSMKPRVTLDSRRHRLLMLHLTCTPSDFLIDFASDRCLAALRRRLRVWSRRSGSDRVNP